jgi:hypothetical protein
MQSQLSFSSAQICSVGANALRSSNTASATPIKVPLVRRENSLVPQAPAKHSLDRFGRAIAGSFTLNRHRPLVELRAGEERRAHRLLAEAAMADPDVERLALRLEADRTAQAATLLDRLFCHRTIPV